MIKLETQYWSLVEIPRQEKAETVPAFVLRACAIMEKTQKSGEGVKTSSKLAEEAADRRERIERLNGNVVFIVCVEGFCLENFTDLYLLISFSRIEGLIYTQHVGFVNPGSLDRRIFRHNRLIFNKKSKNNYYLMVH